MRHMRRQERKRRCKTMIEIHLEEHDLWVIRYALRVLAGKLTAPDADKNKILAKEADEVLQKLHRQT